MKKTRQRLLLNNSVRNITLRYMHSLVMSVTFQTLLGVNAIKPRKNEAFDFCWSENNSLKNIRLLYIPRCLWLSLPNVLDAEVRVEREDAEKDYFRGESFHSASSGATGSYKNKLAKIKANSCTQQKSTEVLCARAVIYYQQWNDHYQKKNYNLIVFMLVCIV